MAKILTPEEQELTRIYYESNELDPARHHSITTERIFTAMRGMVLETIKKKDLRWNDGDIKEYFGIKE
jgi:hypothetical protein